MLCYGKYYPSDNQLYPNMPNVTNKGIILWLISNGVILSDFDDLEGHFSYFKPFKIPIDLNMKHY